MLTVNGRIDVWRIRWHCPAEGSETVADGWLDIAEATMSEGVREMACRLNQGSTSFEKTAENLAWAAHLSISKESLRHYVTERQPMIRYPEFRSRGWQIGSGPTESECKTTTHRVKGRGRRWDSDNAEGMMALACLDDSRMWQTYWANLSPARN